MQRAIELGSDGGASAFVLLLSWLVLIARKDAPVWEDAFDLSFVFVALLSCQVIQGVDKLFCLDLLLDDVRSTAERELPLDVVLSLWEYPHRDDVMQLLSPNN